MAKKKTSKPAKATTKKKPATKAPKKKAAKSSERSRTLPGMEQVRSQKLDNLCEAIGDERDRMNAAKTEEKGLIQGALRAMQIASITTYRHARVELSRVPGAEKLRIRMTKEEGDASDGDLVPGERAEPVESAHESDDEGIAEETVF